MPGLFEQFPHTNLHELNLDWLINMINQFKEELEDSAVLSVNGETGHVTLYESENVILPPLPSGVDQWRLVRLVNGQYAGILFYNGNAYIQRGNETLRLLTLDDIPSSSGVVSWNGLTGVVNVTGQNIPVDDAADADSIAQAVENLNTHISEVETELTNFENIRTIEVQLFNQTINGSPDNIQNTVFNFAQYLPTGYSIWAAEVQIQDAATFYNLPWFNDGLTQATWVYTVSNNSVTIRSKATWNANTSITFTLHCKK